MDKHTPGPLTWEDVVGAGIHISGAIPKGETRRVHTYQSGGDTPSAAMIYTLRKDHHFEMADDRWVQFSNPEWTSMQTDNARLLTSSFNSYDKHCGDRAVECAESDLLGMALTALRTVLAEEQIDEKFRDEFGGYVLDEDVRETCQNVIAKATGEEHA